MAAAAPPRPPPVRPVALTTTDRIDFSQDYSVAAVKGKSAVITGGALGIGAACARSLAEAGAYVTIADVNLAAGIALARELSKQGHHAQFVKCDVTQWNDLTLIFKSAVAFSPDNTVDIVIPNAGIGGAGLLYWLQQNPYDAEKPNSDTPPPPPTRVVDINYMAVYHTVHAAIWYFQNFPGTDLNYSKNVVFVSSMAGYNHMPGSVCYNSSKFGVRGLFWSLRNIEQLLGEGKPKFRANLIAPTWVDTNMTRGLKKMIEQTNAPIKVAVVDDVTHVVMRMVSDENVKGRAAAIAADRLSFDLCDDALGEGVSQTLNDPEKLGRFGLGSGVRGPESITEKQKPNGVTNGETNGDTKGAVEGTIDAPLETTNLTLAGAAPAKEGAPGVVAAPVEPNVA